MNRITKQPSLVEKFDSFCETELKTDWKDYSRFSLKKIDGLVVEWELEMDVDSMSTPHVSRYQIKDNKIRPIWFALGSWMYSYQVFFVGLIFWGLGEEIFALIEFFVGRYKKYKSK